MERTLSSHKTYTLGDQLGRGGVAEVYAATDDAIGIPVVVKVARRFGDALSDDQRSAIFERMATEARLLAALGIHPGVLGCTDFGITPDGRPFMVTERLHGETLESAIRGKIPPAQAVEAVAEVLETLVWLHEQGVLHRDVKPSNIFLLAHGDRRTKLLDFGIAKLLDATVRSAMGNPAPTQEGAWLGTPVYSPPEQMMGKAVGPSADVYSAGMTLWVALTGKRPFPRGINLLQQIEMMREGLPPPWSVNPTLGAFVGVDEVIRQATAFEAKERFQTAADFLAALRRVLARTDGASTPAQASDGLDTVELPVVGAPSQARPQVVPSAPAPALALTPTAKRRVLSRAVWIGLALVSAGVLLFALIAVRR